MAGLADLLKKDKLLAKELVDIDELKNRKEEYISTNVMALNLLYSGKIDGGVPIGGRAVISAQSMTGKSFLSLGIIRNSLRMGKLTVLFDTELAFDPVLAKAIGIDVDDPNFKLFRGPAIEKVKQNLMRINEVIPREQKRDVVYVLDSFGPLVSSKTVNDAISGKDVKDMTLTQKKNELCNLLLMTESTIFVVNHVITNIGGMGDPLSIPGGNKLIFNFDSIVLGRSKAKDTREVKGMKEIEGYIVTAVNHKARGCKENAKLKYRIKVNGGLDPFYGLLPDAIDMGYVEMASSGWYTRPVVAEDKKWRERDLYTAEFWTPIFADTDFKDALERKYSYTAGDVLDIAEGFDFGDGDI